ncbi:gluconate 2-dehydrogenase [Novacetimonas maltaceti]|uniref:Gluconate 2-dehydrogenase subunit 3 n=1 Tax=Novacetimonas maltaceti TaxID=1203393 RepID=A0A2S3W030_9PROT|nr:gluconate 2-dehydrogenase subunit 3 family protein [Novacetimonas maltaceti]POF62212.1 Gluconate 2-dehydrogenase subunit 3 precursor [Novacetimonas maltaceti]PYD59391.1 gluconate 2-dehydrogenase [Novacetimonas maltaceti]
MNRSHALPSRRTFMQAIAATTALVAMPHVAPRAAADTAVVPHAPVFFDAAEWKFLNAACARLIPHDVLGPDAVALGVPRFIDLQMDTPYGRGEMWYMHAPFVEGPPNLGYQLPYPPREVYRRGIAGANAWCLHNDGADFAALSPERQDEVLAMMERGEMMFADLPAAQFFEQLLSNTMEGAFADPIHGGNVGLRSWTMIGFPGARADFMDWVDQYGVRYPLGTVSISGETA